MKILKKIIYWLFVSLQFQFVLLVFDLFVNNFFHWYRLTYQNQKNMDHSTDFSLSIYRLSSPI